MKQSNSRTVWRLGAGFGVWTAVALFVVPAALLAATLPDSINYQGVLRDALDRPLDGPYDMQFRFYSAEVGGDWILFDRHDAKTSAPVTVTEGLFTVALGTGAVSDGNGPGSYTSLAEMFRDYGTVYVEVRVGVVDAGPEVLSPRIPIRSAPYALNAEHLDGWDSSSFVRGAVSSGRVPRSNGTELEDGTIYDVAGRIGIGNANPWRILDVAGDARVTGEARVEGPLRLFTSSPGLEFPDGTVQTTAAWVRPDRPCFDDVNRYVDCGNGAVNDTVTGLIWLKDADCFVTMSYADAQNAALNLAHGQCGLTDRSSPGDWRLPTHAEWLDTVRQARALACPAPVLTDTTGYACWSEGDPFTDVGSTWYWSSTAVEEDPARAWVMGLTSGLSSHNNKTSSPWGWPVRDP